MVGRSNLPLKEEKGEKDVLSVWKPAVEDLNIILVVPRVVLLFGRSIEACMY